MDWLKVLAQGVGSSLGLRVRMGKGAVRLWNYTLRLP